VSGANTSINCPSEVTNLNKFLDIQINKNKTPLSVVSYRPDTLSQEAETIDELDDS
jgi:hypothetical protein